MGDHPQPLPVDAELGERVGAALAVDDDPVEAVEDAAPEIRAVSGAAREKVVRREDRRQMRPEEIRVELRRGHPLDMEHVRADAAEGGEAERMLRHLDRQPQSRPSEEPRREGIEDLAA